MAACFNLSAWCLTLHAIDGNSFHHAGASNALCTCTDAGVNAGIMCLTGMSVGRLVQGLFVMSDAASGVKQLAALRRLSHLDVMYCWKLTDGAMLMLSEMQCLMSINIIGCHRLSKLGKGHVYHLLDHLHAAGL